MVIKANPDKMDEKVKEEILNLIKNMNFRERAVFSLKMREKMTKDGIRKAGCSVWDELTKDLWTRISPIMNVPSSFHSCVIE